MELFDSRGVVPPSTTFTTPIYKGYVLEDSQGALVFSNPNCQSVSSSCLQLNLSNNPIDDQVYSLVNTRADVPAGFASLIVGTGGVGTGGIDISHPFVLGNINTGGLQLALNEATDFTLAPTAKLRYLLLARTSSISNNPTQYDYALLDIRVEDKGEAPAVSNMRAAINAESFMYDAASKAIALSVDENYKGPLLNFIATHENLIAGSPSSLSVNITGEEDEEENILTIDSSQTVSSSNNVMVNIELNNTLDAEAESVPFKIFNISIANQIRYEFNELSLSYPKST